MHLSAGDLLRAARDSGSANGKLINDYIKEGKIVPVDITVALIQQVPAPRMHDYYKHSVM